jgi:hypothetical protein
MSIDTTSTMQEALSTYRRAKAAFDHAANSTDEAETDRLSQVHDGALAHVMLLPAQNARELAEKLKIVCAEDLWRGWCLGEEAFALLAADAIRLA